MVLLAYVRKNQNPVKDNVVYTTMYSIADESYSRHTAQGMLMSFISDI